MNHILIEMIEEQKIEDEQEGHSVSASGSNELLCGEDRIKDIATEFYYHWHNSGGTNTADGFDSWWKLNKARFGFDT